jgi:anhydro-N-acetylmuramic acid kinase
VLSLGTDPKQSILGQRTKEKAMDKVKINGVTLRALGTMSGTSLDGVDAAVLETDGIKIYGFGPTEYVPYTSEEQSVLNAALGHWDGEIVERAADVVMKAHCNLLGVFAEVDLIGFHGQTVAHSPRHNGTLQLGDGAALAGYFKTPVVWDFRSLDIRMGGQGAPLAPFFHFACAKWIKASQPIAFLNLGGVGNITWIDPDFDKPEEVGALLAFDTGPANAPINDLVRNRVGVPFDADGAIARDGTVDVDAVQSFLEDPYFKLPPPKSLDRNDFSKIINSVRNLSDADATATITAMCAASVAQAVSHCPKMPSQILVTGGGRHNSALMEMLCMSLDCSVAPVDSVGLDGDMLEAQAFAYLAVRAARNLPTSCPATTAVSKAVSGGILSFPFRSAE